MSDCYIIISAFLKKGQKIMFDNKAAFLFKTGSEVH